MTSTHNEIAMKLRTARATAKAAAHLAGRVECIARNTDVDAALARARLTLATI